MGTEEHKTRYHGKSLNDFPEVEKTVGNIGVKVYGETSYENQMDMLSHWLHNH